MRGYFKVNLSATSGKRTGENQLILIEKTLRKSGIEFVEDCDGDTVIVRYGEFANDVTWDAHQWARQCRECLRGNAEDIPADALHYGLCPHHVAEMERQQLEAKCEGPSWGKEPVRY